MEGAQRGCGGAQRGAEGACRGCREVRGGVHGGVVAPSNHKFSG